MTQPRICPECHAEIPADAPPGVCPYCALRAGLRWENATRPDHEAGSRAPLTLEGLSRLLPELDDFELIGPGGMGTVYRATHRQLDRPVAVKVLHADLQKDASFARRFVREAQTLARLDHPNIVRVYDFGHREGLSFLVMEFVDGVTLRQAMSDPGLRPEEALSMVQRICEALQYAHDKGVVHRDIKPENILIDRSGMVKIADFGLALLKGTSAESRVTQSAQVMGTPHYMAPEQLKGSAEVDHRADIYALGVIFYEMLTGELPIGHFPLPSQKVEIDVRLDHVVLRTLEKEPRLRYQRASDLSSEVQALSDPDWMPAQQARHHETNSWGRYEYRSRRTLWGLPLVHVAFSGGRSGLVPLARGVIAVGDKAVGVIAIGGIAVGGLTMAGVSLGVISVGGLSLGVLVAVGAIAIGGFAAGHQAFGVVATGVQPRSIVDLSAETMPLMSPAAWGLGVAVVTTALVALVLWRRAAAARRAG